MIDTADEIEGIFVPSLEHIVVSKAEAYLDRTEGDLSKEKYWEDLIRIRKKLKEKGLILDREEIERVVKLRPERKIEDLLRILNRYLDEVIEHA